jgi:macrodomain Ter protein organizer (MatP/YcbG family)
VRKSRVGKKAVWVNRYLERDTSEKSDEKYRIGCRVDYVVWAKLQVREKQKNMPLSSLCMNILEEQIIECKKNEIKCCMSESQTNSPT